MPSQSLALGADDRRAAARGHLVDGRRRLRLERPDDDRHARLDDAGLLDRDLAQRRAEIALMIERDRGDRGRDQARRRHDVGRVEPAAEADLEDGDLDAGAAEELEGDRGRHFEEGRLRRSSPPSARRPSIDAAHVVDGRDQRVAGDRTAVDDEALREIDEMRRRVARRAVPGGAQRGVDHRRHRALAVGAGDVDRAERALGMAEPRDDGGDVVEAELDAELFEREQPG